jgi:hypothetical protein
MLINFDLFSSGTVIFEQLPRIRFPTTPQVLISSAAPIHATFRALDQTGTQIAQDGAMQVGPGPVEADTVFQVQVFPRSIRRLT